MSGILLEVDKIILDIEYQIRLQSNTIVYNDGTSLHKGKLLGYKYALAKFKYIRNIAELAYRDKRQVVISEEVGASPIFCTKLEDEKEWKQQKN